MIEYKLINKDKYYENSNYNNNKNQNSIRSFPLPKLIYDDITPHLEVNNIDNNNR